jgi:hypothetical protein
VNATITGANFQPGGGTTIVALTRATLPNIPGTNVNVVSANQITCTFNLSGAAVGSWDVYVCNPDGQNCKLGGGFTVGYQGPVITSISPDSGPAGTAVTLNGSNFGSTRGSSYVTFGTEKASSYSAWSDTCIVCAVPQGLSGTVSVTVTTAGGSSGAVWFTVTEPPPTPPAPAPTPYSLYLAEGSTAWGFSCYITVENPNNSAVTVRMTYQTSEGSKAGPTFSMPALSQATVIPAETLGSADFSTKIECLEGNVIAADRTMIWNSGGGEEAHAAVAVTSPARTWYLPEGSSAWGFECFLLIQNPGEKIANCKITYMLQDGTPQEVEVAVPAGSRATYNMKDHIGEKDASIKVESDVPVIPERAMYRNSRREGHDSTGTVAPATDYYLAEGAVGYDSGFVTWVLIQNPQDEPTDVSLYFMTRDGEVKGPSFRMEPRSRKTVRLNDFLPPGTDVSTHVHGSAPIIAERAMYWNSGDSEVCHDSIGMAEAHATFFLPDGESSNGKETWTLVQNPNPAPIEVEISYFATTGVVTRTEMIEANSRRTFNMEDHSGLKERAAILVRSKDPSKKVMVERAMYWNRRGTGTDTIGGYSD